jgi:hypothetical protein
MLSIFCNSMGHLEEGCFIADGQERHTHIYTHTQTHIYTHTQTHTLICIAKDHYSLLIHFTTYLPVTPLSERQRAVVVLGGESQLFPITDAEGRGLETESLRNFDKQKSTKLETEQQIGWLTLANQTALYYARFELLV